MLRLDILRHAKTEPDHEDGDHERALLPRGRKDAAAMGHEIASRGFVPTLILCSTARRTAETLDLVLPFMLPKPQMRLDPALYLAAPATILKRIASIADTPSILLIGHNPGLHQVAYTLSGGGKGTSRLAEKFPTCAFASLQSKADSWSAAIAGSWTLLAEFRPADL